MSQKLQPVRGTHDILPKEFEEFHAVVTRARELATLYGFKEMATPIFEPTEVFSRSMGETSDVVSKEMFTFNTKGDESVTLRPEFTAGIVRAFLSNGMQQHLPLKLFSTGPLFRYERPQKGRQRQFHQVNFEWLGDDSVAADVELICLAGYLLFYLSGNKGCKLLINSLGDKESRATYRDALVSYLAPYAKELSEDSQRRLLTNPLRILDSKSEQDKKVIEKAPKMTDYLSTSSRQRFEQVLALLNTSNDKVVVFQDIVVESSLVRGLDYYTDTVFEFVAETGELGAQNTVLAGGRYDGLVGSMGGKPTPAIGFAAGIERLLLLSQNNKNVWENIAGIKIFILPFEDIKESVVHNIATELRFSLHEILQKQQTKRRCSVEILWHGKLAKCLERAAKQGATHVVILPSEEMRERRSCIIQNMETRNKKEVPVSEFNNHDTLKKMFGITELDSRLRGNDEGQE